PVTSLIKTLGKPKGQANAVERRNDVFVIPDLAGQLKAFAESRFSLGRLIQKKHFADTFDPQRPGQSSRIAQLASQRQHVVNLEWQACGAPDLQVGQD